MKNLKQFPKIICIIHFAVILTTLIISELPLMAGSFTDNAFTKKFSKNLPDEVIDTFMEQKIVDKLIYKKVLTTVVFKPTAEALPASFKIYANGIYVGTLNHAGAAGSAQNQLIQNEGSNNDELIMEFRPNKTYHLMILEIASDGTETKHILRLITDRPRIEVTLPPAGH